MSLQLAFTLSKVKNLWSQRLKVKEWIGGWGPLKPQPLAPSVLLLQSHCESYSHSSSITAIHSQMAHYIVHYY